MQQFRVKSARNVKAENLLRKPGPSRLEQSEDRKLNTIKRKTIASGDRIENIRMMENMIRQPIFIRQLKGKIEKGGQQKQGKQQFVSQAG